jgi:MoxR-like ATPase
MGMNFKEVRKFLPMIFQTNLRPCLLGHTGIGKTECITQFAHEFGLDLIIIHVAQLEPSDFVGLYHVNEDGRTDNCSPSWLPYKEETTAKGGKVVNAKATSTEEVAHILKKAGAGVINPKGGGIFLDEINRSHEDMRQALYQFLQSGEIHTYALPKGDPSKLNELGLPMGKYHIATAANPSSEGYETYEFDPALMNRLAWVNFTPSFDETKIYLEGKYGRHPVLSWVDSDKGLIDYGDEFQINGLLYSPRMTENHIKLFNASKKEGKEFRRKVFDTIMPKDKVQSFMAYLEEIEYINFKDVLNGVKGDKAKKLEALIKDNRMDILSTINNDMSDFFDKYNLGEGSELFKNEEDAVKNAVDFLVQLKDELILAFIDGLKNNYNNPKSVLRHPYFHANIKPRAKAKRDLFT